MPLWIAEPSVAGRHVAVALLVAAATLGSAPVASAASGAIALSPAPGTPDANPAAQISVLGVAPARIVSVRVAGARTGLHAGRLRPYSGNRGASFVPRERFAQGERVAVVVHVRGRPLIRSSFTVARLGPIPPVLNLPATQPDKLEHFASRPDLLAPRITVNRDGPSASGASMFLTPLPSPVIQPGATNTVTIAPVGPGGPMIVDAHGGLVWFRQLTMPVVAANLDVQRYRGKPVLTWWQGPVTTQAFGLGKAIVADTSYRTIAEIQAGNGYAMDLHELRLTDDGDALVTIYSPVLVHLPGTPAGKLSPVLDSIIQQIDVRTGLVVWEWHALGHIPLADSYATPENSASYDAFHINSVQPLAGDRLLVSARDTSAIYEVDRATGRIRWTLGGKASTFRLGARASFWLQHDARALPGDRVSLFDDQGGPPQKAPASRGLILQLDHRRRTAKVVRELTRAPQTSAQSEGSTQLLPSGNVFVAFGSAGSFSEFSATGRTVFDAQLPDGDGSYRIVRHDWSATPATRPTVVVRRADPSHVTVSVSWNGATRVARWEVLAGSDAGGLTRVAGGPRGGFETTFAVASTAGTFAVRALDADGHVLATSVPVAAS
ncbi:MAG TPA: arylsulfotransferase family protein [Baekduia sp.]|uniref:arylsulfotransferase family protein n=1 Tax=Baekduia sp. TaxID=2600305 RepID=UPI002C16DC7B|nr:arylsulfotransferase family protein [Baekduia sp.]HMJ32474.1 arylsulfotransferase family protein [Baekduia sp.]